MNITQKQTMSSREIAELVESRHDSVKRSMERLAKGDVISVTPMVEPVATGGKPTEVLNVNKRDSYIVVAQLSPQFTARLVDRWQELEAQQAPAIPKTLSEALRLAADQAEFIEQQAELLEKQQPSVEFVERYVESSGTFGFREICKQLGAKENKFRAFLQSQKIMYRLGSDWTPYAQHMDKGFFEVKTGTANGHAYKSPRFTAKGAEWISGEWDKYLRKNPEVVK